MLILLCNLILVSYFKPWILLDNVVFHHQVAKITELKIKVRGEKSVPFSSLNTLIKKTNIIWVTCTVLKIIFVTNIYFRYNIYNTISTIQFSVFKYLYVGQNKENIKTIEIKTMEIKMFQPKNFLLCINWIFAKKCCNWKTKKSNDLKKALFTGLEFLLFGVFSSLPQI